MTNLMNRASVVEDAFENMPKVAPRTVSNMSREKLPTLLSGSSNIGIELGVAAGRLSRRFLATGKFKVLFGVDVYGDIHDTAEYKRALGEIGLEGDHKLLRLSFEDALDIFPDEYFDFIYVDGFAHTGEDGGRTIIDWYRKLKVGGIMSGDDYHKDWPLVMWAVNSFALQTSSTVYLTEVTGGDQYSLYPSWFLKKEEADRHLQLAIDVRLAKIADAERRRIHRLRMSPALRLTRKVKRLLKGTLGLR